MASRMIALALGIGCVAWLPSLPSALALVSGGVLVLCFAKRFPQSVSLILCFLAGMAYGTHHGKFVLHSLLPPQLGGEDLRAVGRIVSLPDYSPQRGGSYRFEFLVESWLSKDGAVTPESIAANKLRLTFSPAKTLATESKSALLPAYGQRWQFHVRLKRPRSFANPGGFDYTAWLLGRGVHATGYVRGATFVGADQGVLSGLRAKVVYRLRDKLLSYSQGGVLLALAAGEREGLSDRQWDLFRLSGTSHLMAISGLHIGIAAGLGWWLGRVVLSLASIRLPLILSPTLAPVLAPMLAPMLAVMFAGVYAWLAGFSLPTQRAFIMVVLAVLALALSRHIGRWQTWCWALLLVLVFNPLASLQAGFWLSFAAVAVLLAVVEREQGWRSLLRAQWVLLLGLAPFGLVFFQQVSLLAFPVNLVAVPLFSLLIVPLVLLALSLEILSSSVAAPVWALTNIGLDLFMGVLEKLSAYERVFVLQYSPGSFELFALLLFAFLILMPKVFPAKYLALLCLLPLLALSENRLASGEYSVKVLDVGQGLSVVVQTRNHSLVYDVGPRYSERFNMVEAALLPVLKRSKIEYLDKLIISHGDSDHAGAYQRLIDEMPFGDFLSGASLPGAKPCVAGQHWQWDSVDFAIVSPLAGSKGGSNNGSCVLLVQSGAGRTLLPGDIEFEVEQRLLSVVSPNISLLLAPHHGSKTSSSPVFVSLLNPEVVVFSAGHKHRYGHPAPEVKQRYQQQGSELAETANTGMITVVLGPQGIKNIEHFREQRHYYWNRPGD